MKKFRIVISMLVLVFSLVNLAACGKEVSNKNSDNKIKIHFWNHWSAEGNEAKFFDSKIKEYEKLHKNIDIEQTNVPIDDYTGSKLTTAFATGSGPDIFSASPGTINTFVESHITMDLTPYIDSKVKKQFSEEALKDVTRNKKIIAAPFEQDLMALFYDKNMFKNAGLTPPKTWDEMINAAKELTTSDISGITYDLTKGAYGNFSFMPFVWQSGGEFFEGKKAKLNSPEVIKALTLWKRMVNDGSANLKPSRFASDVGILGDGETAMWIGGSFGIAALEDQYPNANIGVVPLPVPEDGKPTSVAGGWKLVVNNNSKVKDEAAKFVQWLFLDNDTKNPIQWNTEAKFSYSPRKDVVEAVKPVYQKGLRAVFTNEIYGTQRPELAMDPKVADIIGDMIQDALFNNSPEKAAEVANEKLQEFFDNEK